MHTELEETLGAICSPSLLLAPSCFCRFGARLSNLDKDDFFQRLFVSGIFFFLLVSVVQTSNWCGVFRNCEEGMKSRADLALGRNHCSLTHSRPDTLPRGFLFCGFDSDWECGKLMRLCIITRGTLSTGYFIGNNRPVTSPFPTPSFPTRFCSCIACCRLYKNDFFWWW